jgi:hypothetical protein
VSIVPRHPVPRHCLKLSRTGQEWRVRTMFTIYAVLIVSGLVFFTVIGLVHH